LTFTDQNNNKNCIKVDFFLAIVLKMSFLFYINQFLSPVELQDRERAAFNFLGLLPYG